MSKLSDIHMNHRVVARVLQFLNYLGMYNMELSFQMYGEAAVIKTDGGWATSGSRAVLTKVPDLGA